MECDGSVDQIKKNEKIISLFSSFLLFLAMNIKSIKKNDDVAVKFEIGALYELEIYKTIRLF
jgi:hypothetical protein